MRIGQGIDVHAFQEGGTLKLGGVSIPFERSLKAHSDGDVLLHALCDALLGAAGLGDIGHLYPDNDSRFENINSRELLRDVFKRISGKSFQVANADMTVVAQAPKLAPYIQQMVNNISADLSIETSKINIKATTSEHLGFTGREEGIAAFAVVLLQDRKF